MKERETRPTQNEAEENSLLERIRELEAQTKRLRLALAALFALGDTLPCSNETHHLQVSEGGAHRVCLGR